MSKEKGVCDPRLREAAACEFLNSTHGPGTLSGNRIHRSPSVKPTGTEQHGRHEIPDGPQ
jgi:hypothetical protein